MPPAYADICDKVWSLHQAQRDKLIGNQPRNLLFPPSPRGRAVDLLFVGISPNHYAPIHFGPDRQGVEDFARRFHYVSEAGNGNAGMHYDPYYGELLKFARRIDPRFGVWRQVEQNARALLVEFTDCLHIATNPGDRDDIWRIFDPQTEACPVWLLCKEILEAELMLYQPRIVIGNGRTPSDMLWEVCVCRFDRASNPAFFWVRQDWCGVAFWVTRRLANGNVTITGESVILNSNEQIEMSEVRSRHQCCAGIARRAGHQPGQSGGGASQRQEGRLAQRQAEKEHHPATRKLTTMAIVHKSIEVHLPNRAPYDTDYDLEAFAGEYILPIERKLKRFWFTRYGAAGQRHILFRFSTAKFEHIEAHFARIVADFGGAGCEPYNYVGDLGSHRFLRTDARNQSQVRRANFVYAFLTAAAKLFLESIVRQADGHWRHETEQASNLNRETSLESYHHLFCNMTGVPLDAGLIIAPTGNIVLLDGDLYARKAYQDNYQQQRPDHKYQRVRIHH